jgi:gamma-glutamyltranspeptidase / glutathione hydrolase
MGPPSSGALTVAQTLKLIEPIDGVQGETSLMSAQALHLIGEAEKLAFADRNRYIADPDIVPQAAGLLDEGYLTERRKLIDPARAMAKPQAGLPPGLAKRTYGADQTFEAAGTSHISIVDDDGNAVSMTTTIESAFGSHLWVAGFLLNNQLTDFSFVPADKDGAVVANAVGGGKRPRSSLAPTIFFDDKGALEGVTGSPGGSRIILFVIKALVAMIDWDMDAQEAAALVNFGSDGSGFQLEFAMASLVPALKLIPYGHAVNGDPMTSGVHTILRRKGQLQGGADPRREGVALGD